MINDHPGGGAETPPVDGDRITGPSDGDAHEQPIDGDAGPLTSRMIGWRRWPVRRPLTPTPRSSCWVSI